MSAGVLTMLTFHFIGTVRTTMKFDLIYSAKNGQQVTKTIDCDFPTATRIARELAQASGKRATIRRSRSDVWRVYAIDGHTRERTLLWSGMTKREAYLRWRLWDDRQTKTVLVMLPAWFVRRSRTP